jgi:alpha-tubulin suppressor-like RCC1 family protein
VRSKRGLSIALGLLLLGVGVSVDPASATPAGRAASPVPESGSSDWRQVSAGAITTCGVRTSGRLYCWGYGQGGELGDGGSSDQSVPTEVAGGETTWRSVSVGSGHACAIRAPGRLYCWGNNFYGPLGVGTAGGSRNVPTLVRGGFTDWTSVSAGQSSTCGRRAIGRLYCWGRDDKGQLGTGPGQGDRSTPGLVAGGITDWTSVDVGYDAACGRRAIGRLYCWGSNRFGNLGNGTGSGRQSPTLVAGGFTDWTMVSAGDDHACGLRANGQLRCWGGGAQGQRGDGTTSPTRLTPVLVNGTGWTQVTAGFFHTCARRSTGRLYCWGDNQNVQLGIGPSGSATRPTPTQVAGGATDWQGVSAGYRSSCARTRSGRLFCWGLDFAGALGNGSAGSDNSPSEVYAP